MKRSVACCLGLVLTLFTATVVAGNDPAPKASTPAPHPYTGPVTTGPTTTAPATAPQATAPAATPQAAPYPATPPAPYSPTQPAPSPPTAVPPPAYGYPPPAYGYPPPAYGYPAYSPYGAGYHPIYEAQKRSPGLALLFEFLVPGIGSIYGDHVLGAIISWGIMAGGFVLILDGINTSSGYCDSYNCSSHSNNDGEIALGLLLILGGRVYGFIDAYTSTNAYNTRLRESLGLPAWMSLGVKPIRTQSSVAYAPTLQLRF